MVSGPVEVRDQTATVAVSERSIERTPEPLGWE
jgi:hypothetical protein